MASYSATETQRGQSSGQCIALDDGLRTETCSGSDKKNVALRGIIGDLINITLRYPI
jgi:hypothetical protein